MTLNESIGVLKIYRKGDFVDDYKLCEAIDTVLSLINTPNKTGLDDRLQEKIIEQPDNQGGLSNKLDEKFSPELLQTYYPFMEEMEGLLVRKKLSMVAIANAQSIIVRCHLHGMEVGWDEALRFKELQK